MSPVVFFLAIFSPPYSTEDTSGNNPWTHARTMENEKFMNEGGEGNALHGNGLGREPNRKEGKRKRRAGAHSALKIQSSLCSGPRRNELFLSRFGIRDPRVAVRGKKMKEATRSERFAVQRKLTSDVVSN